MESKKRCEFCRELLPEDFPYSVAMALHIDKCDMVPDHIRKAKLEYSKTQPFHDLDKLRTVL